MCNRTMVRVIPEIGGAEAEAAALRTRIAEQADELSVKGTVYYVSEDGDDSHTGISPKTALRTIAAVNQLELSEGDAVLFARGSVFRTDTTLELRGGVTYAAYGNGEKPLICGSIRNYAEEGVWSSDEQPNLWVTLAAGEAGVMTFDHDTAVGVRKYAKEELTADGEYYHDTQSGRLYLYLQGQNPSDAFETIEIGTTGHLILCYHENHISIRNLSLKYTGIHGMCLGDNSHVSIRGCEISWIGGAIFNEESKVRLGNGIQFWNQCRDVNISYCHIHQIFDAAFTFQGSYPEGVSYTDIVFEHNLIEYCSMNFEFWGTDEDKGERVKIDAVRVKDNIFRFSGYGWGGLLRPDIGDQAFILGWGNTYLPGKVSRFSITDNCFDCADSNFVWSPLVFAMDGNTYYQKAVSGRNSHVEVLRDSGLYATDQSSFETGVLAFEQQPAKVRWLTVPE